MNRPTLAGTASWHNVDLPSSSLSEVPTDASGMEAAPCSQPAMGRWCCHPDRAEWCYDTRVECSSACPSAPRHHEHSVSIRELYIWWMNGSIIRGSQSSTRCVTSAQCSLSWIKLLIRIMRLEKNVRHGKICLLIAYIELNLNWSGRIKKFGRGNTLKMKT